MDKKPKFSEQVYSTLKKVPKGKVTTYKDLAHALGSGAYRGVGQALRRNPYAPHVPCHRVVASNGRIGGFGGDREGMQIQKKIALLKLEGVVIKDDMVVDFERKRFQFSTGN
jgi:methylated-DNA-[protein]-cysteine S-methyltransferase